MNASVDTAGSAAAVAESASPREPLLVPAVTITRRVTFAAAHALRRADWDDARNREVYGSCVNDHGHNYQLEVTVGGTRLGPSGMLVNLRSLDRAIRAAVIDRVDHRHLNHDVEFLQGIVPTVENLALAFAAELERALSEVTLHRVRLVESENNSAEVAWPWL